MSRHLSALHLAQLDTEPTPAEGEIALYAGPDGLVHRATADGARGPISPWRSTTLAVDLLMEADQPATDITGLQMNVEPGLHQVRATFTLAVVGAVTLTPQARIFGPTADFVDVDLTIVFAVDNWFETKMLSYGDLLSFDTVSPEQQIQVRVSATIRTTAAGVLGFQASSAHVEGTGGSLQVNAGAFFAVAPM
uniref:hypothetical protein n=1 Tax=Streptosporangium sp. CA-235898 TaxID=3240073 RepID=UPI003F497050